MRVTLSNLSQALAGAALMAAALGAQAQSNLNFLNDTPITYFSKADVASLTKAVHQARDEGKDGETTEWNNGNRGVRIEAKLTPSTAEQDGHTCREIATEINAKGQSMTLRPRYCKTPAGKWQLQKR
ncbi:RT0821/Lpp0805 family surface protein [Burkholderia perseverans]|uniref:RT0821/Lpp0805 family surface protein n=1 Tax=Burkholderia perseverans TaxID=2615214 RepID=UPI001FEE218D|nr:RT0821/Lpp0805 family surface protein [Burkholderia perseverans]